MLRIVTVYKVMMPFWVGIYRTDFPIKTFFDKKSAENFKKNYFNPYYRGILYIKKESETIQDTD